MPAPQLPLHEEWEWGEERELIFGQNRDGYGSGTLPVSAWCQRQQVPTLGPPASHHITKSWPKISFFPPFFF